MYWGKDEKIGKKDQQDLVGKEVESKALWKKAGSEHADGDSRKIALHFAIP